MKLGNTITYLFFMFFFEVLLLIAFLPIIFFAIWLLKQDTEGLTRSIVQVVASGLGLGGHFAYTWFAHKASYKCAFEDDSIFEAIKNTWLEAKLYLSFLPIIGGLFRSENEIENPYRKENNNDEEK